MREFETKMDERNSPRKRKNKNCQKTMTLNRDGNVIVGTYEKIKRFVNKMDME